MSGIEVAGIALAVLPLLVSAAQNYNNCLVPFWRYRGFPNEAQRFLKLLKIQRTIFRNHCTILFEHFVDHDAAVGILHSPYNRMPSTFKPEDELSQLLSESKEACIDTIELILEHLRKIEHECRDLVVTMNSERASETYVSWRRRITAKLRFSISESQLQEHLNALQTLNENFKTLASQSLKLEEQRHFCNEEVSKKAKQEIEKYSMVGKVSRQLHEALGQACTTCAKHQAHTCAKVEYTISTTSFLPQIKFRMALAELTTKNDSIAFIVNTTLEDSELGNNSDIIPDLSKPENSLKRCLNKPPDDTEQRNKKNIRFESSALQSAPRLQYLTIADPFFFDGDPRRDFCERLRQCQSQLVQPHVCVGKLRTTTGYNASVFLSTTNHPQASMQPISLSQLLSSFSEPGKFSGFPLYQRLGLAKVLTTAVLQYRATPWLQMYWKSNDVVFFASDVQSLQYQSIALGSPHFNTTIDQGAQTSQIGDRNVTQSISEARNPLLCSLGIVLFEIGCWKSADSCSDLNQARQLLKSGRSSGRFEMGPRYDEIVEKLIECDFGCGADLSKSSLQIAVYRDVVCPLEKLELDLKALQI